jgi:hypothetical protein
MRALRETQPDGSGEAKLTDALSEVIVHGGRVLAVALPAGAQRSRFGESHRARAQLLDG